MSNKKSEDIEKSIQNLESKGKINDTPPDADIGVDENLSEESPKEPKVRVIDLKNSATDDELGFGELYKKSLEDNPVSLGSLGDVFKLLNNPSKTPSVSFKLLGYQIYEDPIMKKDYTVRMLTVEEEKFILSIEDMNSRVKAYIQESIRTIDGEPVPINKLYQAEMDYLYMRYRIHNLDKIYHMSTTCPRCNQTRFHDHDLRTMKFEALVDKNEVTKSINLPILGIAVVLRYPTIGDIEKAESRAKEALEEYRSDGRINYLTPDIAMRSILNKLYRRASMIESIGGIPINGALDSAIRILEKLDSRDNAILEIHEQEMAGKFGMDPVIELECPQSGCKDKGSDKPFKYMTQFPLSWEFFRPSVRG